MYRFRIEKIMKRKIPECKPVEPLAGYSIEEHGEEGEYALYFGRSDFSHGLNLCKLSDFDMNGPLTRKQIVDALNRGLEK